MHTDFLFIILLCIVAEIGFDIIIIPIIQIIRYADVRRGKPAASRVIFSLSLGAGSDGLGLVRYPPWLIGLRFPLILAPSKDHSHVEPRFLVLSCPMYHSSCVVAISQ